MGPLESYGVGSLTFALGMLKLTTMNADYNQRMVRRQQPNHQRDESHKS
jgi:hypothetical protein